MIMFPSKRKELVIVVKRSVKLSGGFVGVRIG